MMKRHIFLLALAGLAMAGCTNEDVISPAANGEGEASPISFSVYKANMSRDDISTQGLQTESYDFGVWAYKTNTQWDHTGLSGENPTGGDVVMSHYLVGYWDATNSFGYEPKSAQCAYGSLWFYEKLGNEDGSCFTFHENNSIPSGTYHPSIWDHQYLKYWDLSKTYVNFYACAPYDAAASFVPATRTMTFKEINETDNADLMYGCASMSSQAGFGGAQVPIQFRRLASRIRLAFFSELQGYKVEIIDYKETGDATFMIPAVTDGTNYTKAASDDDNGYVAKCTPVVTWGTEGNASATVSYNSPTKGYDNMKFNLEYWEDSNYATAHTGTEVPYLYANRIFTAMRRVLPCGSVQNPGFTLNISFKLTAVDTGEVIYVYGARVHVPYECTQWLPNKLYTYVFKITNNVPGSTAGKQEPGVDPTDKALYPIVFNNITVEDIDSQEIEYPGESGGYFN